MFCPNALVWGDVATWVAGVGTALTLFFAVYQWWQQWRTEQAKAIYAYLWRENDNLELRIGNGSGLPVHEVFLFHMMAGSPTAIGSSLLVRGWKFVGLHTPITRVLNRWWVNEIVISRHQKKHPLPVMPPVVGLDDVAALPLLPRGEYRVEKSLGHMRLTNKGDLSFAFGVEVVFRDNRGRRWARRSDGRLKRTYFNPWWSLRIRQGIVNTLSMTPGYSRIVSIGEPGGEATRKPDAGEG